MPLPVTILLIVFIAIAVRQIGRVRLRIWQIMTAGAVAALAAGQISPAAAVKSVNIDIMLFLFGMFAVGQALEESGYLSYLSYRYFRRAKTADALVLFVLFGMGIASAFLMNDTLAIIGTPVVLHLAQKHVISPKLLLLSLAFAITIGSVVSPIGNPQNLLIAVNGNMPGPFAAFFKHLFLPTIVNLFLAYVLLRLLYKKEFHDAPLDHSREPIADHDLAKLSRFSLLLTLVLTAAKIIAAHLGNDSGFRLTYIALAAAAPILLFSPRRWELLRKMDWHTLIFFAAMFILMQSVWDSGYFQSLTAGGNLRLNDPLTILAVGILLSQLISNVPLVALYLPILALAGASTQNLVTLAAASTIAGNLFILGAASNVIIIQNAEKKTGETLTFLEFARVGIPLTLLNALVYYLFL